MRNEMRIKIMKEYLNIVYEIYGLYLDATSGFLKNYKEMQKIQKSTSERVKISVADLDRRSFIYGKGNPNLPGSYKLHECSQEQYKIRNKENDHNYKIMANLCIVLLYQFWEYYRSKVGNNIEIDIMGDLRLLRHSIIHHRGVATKEIKRCKILKWFEPKKEIFLNKEQFEVIIYNIKENFGKLIK